MKRLFVLLLLVPLAGSVQAQKNDSLIVLFLTDPGVRPAKIFTDGFESGDVTRWDANGDDRVDLILQRDDDEGNLLDLRVMDTLTSEVLWEVNDVASTLGFNIGMPPTLWGFADPSGTGNPVAVFYNEVEVRGYTLANELAWKIDEGQALSLLGAIDLTDDGAEEILVYYPDTKQVAGWGRSR